MEKVYDLNIFIQNVTTGAFAGTGIISYARTNDIGNVKHCDAKQLAKCIASYFNILDDYPDLQNIEFNTELNNSLLNDFEEYKKNNYIDVKLDNELKEKLDSYGKEELNLEFKKFFQNLLTNKEVLRYIKELIDKKDYYFYEKYNNYTKEQCKEEIETLKQIFKILENVEYKENRLGVKEKHITFEPGSYEYENITPFICFDIYDMNHYKRVLNLLENKLENDNF
ncbi:MAG: hypothetical protein ACI4XR_02305 [Bacilli bacterium]